MGELQVPEEALWGCQTQRSIFNFQIGTDTMPSELIHAFGIQKRAAAEANAAALGPEVARAIQESCDDIINGNVGMEHFPLVIYQTGSGTQTNMNVNEVIANLANAKLGEKHRGTKHPVHPNDHVNKGQSSNDSFPTAMHIAAVLALHHRFLPALADLRQALLTKAQEFQNVVKIGRTHLQDATPITLGQEFSAWAAQIERSEQRVQDVLKRLYFLAQGGTAVGTGLNTVEGFDLAFAANVAKITGLPFVTNPNKFEGMASHDAITELASVQNTIATSLLKIGNDIRLLSSGPMGGLGEIWLPANEPGSSIMPGKVNPTQAEALTMVAAQVMGNSLAVSVSNTHGQLDLNAFKPVMIHNVLKSNNLLADALGSFSKHCVCGITANHERIKEHLDKDLMLVTALNAKIGYEKGADVAKTALAERKGLRQVAVFDRQYLTEAEYDAIIVPANMVAPTPRSHQEL